MKSKRNLIILTLVIAISLIGVTYAFFDYYMLGANQRIYAGKVQLYFDEGEDTINRKNTFPETKEKARNRTDNFVTFTVSGVNTTEDQDIWYEIMLNEGDPETGMTRYNPEHLVFDLVELNEDGTEGEYLVDAMSFSDINSRRIWVNTVDRNTSTTVNKTYKLRMWLSENVLISNSNPNADYPATGYENYYASVKVSVYGDFIDKQLPYNYMANLGNPEEYIFWPDSIESVKTDITEVKFVSMNQDLINQMYSSATIKEDVSDTTKVGSVKAWLETSPLDSTKYIMYVASEGITFFPKNCVRMFGQFSGLTNISFGNVNTSYVENMFSMFEECSGLTSLDLNNWDTSSVTEMSCMFWGCSSLTSLDLNNWDTSSVTNMDGMFDSCSGLTSLDLSNWDTNSVTYMGYMFSYCSSLTSLDLNNWDTSSVTDMESMFFDCYSLTSLDVGDWNTKSVTGMGNMFWGCSGLISLDLNNWDTSSVTYMSGIFSYCSSLTSLDLNNWDTSSVTDMGMMFYNCSGLTSLDLSNFDTSNVTSMGSMFDSCSGLTSLDLSNFDTSNVTSMDSMFEECSGLTSLDISNFTFDSITSYRWIFSNMKDRTDNTPTIIVKGETEQNWILALNSNDRPESWTTDNVVVEQ